jgi:hypothetical protein
MLVHRMRDRHLPLGGVGDREHHHERIVRTLELGGGCVWRMIGDQLGAGHLESFVTLLRPRNRVIFA